MADDDCDDDDEDRDGDGVGRIGHEVACPMTTVSTTTTCRSDCTHQDACCRESAGCGCVSSELRMDVGYY